MTDFVGTKASEEIRGGVGDDLISGRRGDDTLVGSQGLDTLVGGHGDDRYEVSSQGGFDEVVELKDGGVDTIELQGEGVYRLARNVEDVDATWWAGAIVGNGEDNVMRGVPDPFSGTLRTSMFGKGGDDWLMGGDASTTLDGGSGEDTLIALMGTTMLGGTGNDLLIVAIGAGKLSGGEDGDIFRFNSSLGALVTDFDATEGDIIELTGIDADTLTDGDQTFRFVEAFGGHAGEAVLIYSAKRDMTRLLVDQDGDGASDSVLALRGYITSDAGWVL